MAASTYSYLVSAQTRGPFPLPVGCMQTCRPSTTTSSLVFDELSPATSSSAQCPGETTSTYVRMHASEYSITTSIYIRSVIGFSSSSFKVFEGLTMESRFRQCFEQWVRVQDSELQELLRVSAGADGTGDPAELRALVERNMMLYEEYVAQRHAASREEGPTFLCPPWCTTFENAFLWMGGCRPSAAVRLLYSLSSSNLEAHLDEIFSGISSSVHSAGSSGAGAGGGGAAGSMGLMGLSPNQVNQVNELHVRTIGAEDRISSRMATLQEDMVDTPVLDTVRSIDWRVVERRSNGNQCDANVKAVMDRFAVEAAGVMEEADNLRLATVRELVMEILTPRQAVELLLAAKQLHLAIHQWGLQRNLEQERS